MIGERKVAPGVRAMVVPNYASTPGEAANRCEAARCGFRVAQARLLDVPGNE
jgi:hypothetical protein